MKLRPATEDDLETLYLQQRSLSFSSDRETFFEKTRANLTDDDVLFRIIVDDDNGDNGDKVAGYVAKFVRHGTGDDEGKQTPEVAYVLGEEFHGRGLATKALAALLVELDATTNAPSGREPLFALTATDNAASIAVLKKNGFEFVRNVEWRRGPNSPLLKDYFWQRAAAPVDE